MQIKMKESIEGQIVDIENRRIYPGEIFIENGLIVKIVPREKAPERYMLPGFIDAHIHIESSMLVPYEFARLALRHGTVATVSDPHEIANVLGLEGVEYMIENARNAKLKFHFGAPSCVPATEFESAGACLDLADVEKLLDREDIFYLSEMMNYPGVLNGDQEVIGKIKAAHKRGKLVDGHAPGLRGEEAKKYIAAGISTDHECYTLEEAQEKAGMGMKIIIREGSAAKNFEALHPIIKEYPGQTMFCSDDKHPDDLVEGHINQMVVRALKYGYDMFDVLRIACLNPNHHYGLTSGIMKTGDPADFIIVNNLNDFEVRETYINGEKVASKKKSFLKTRCHPILNQFNSSLKSPKQFRIKATGRPIPVIKALDGELITEKSFADLPENDGFVQCDSEQNILKIAVVNRYRDAPVATGFIQNFGLKEGAIAGTVAHDSHNIIAVGTKDEDLARAVNCLIKVKGGLVAINDEEEMILPLQIAGLMSELTGEEVAKAYSAIDAFVKSMGCTLKAPFMTLSFMALLVIPKIKMSDKGLFDAEEFKFYNL